jgi:hemoglobin-like flavoprotein
MGMMMSILMTMMTTVTMVTTKVCISLLAQHRTSRSQHFYAILCRQYVLLYLFNTTNIAWPQFRGIMMNMSPTLLKTPFYLILL